jgi:hypothetical protein
MKPIREYLLELPKPYNTLALSVVDESCVGYKDKVDSLFSAVYFMCDWDKTPPSYSFWKQVYDWCINPKNKKLPPIPVEQVEKPKYYKNSEGFIVEYLAPKNDTEFTAKIVAGNKRGYYDFVDCLYSHFEPCDYTPAVEVSPEVEQPKTEIKSCLDKKLSDNPTIADSIGSHMQLAFEYSKKLVNENTRLRAELYRLPILEQENTQLKAQLAELLSNPK